MNFKLHDDEEFARFNEEEKKWLDDYSMFMALKYKFNFTPWNLWVEDIKFRKKETIEKCKD